MSTGAKNLLAKNLILLVIVAVITITPLIIQSGAEFGGADNQAEEVIFEIKPEYEPWFESIWEPPSGEIESLLFALQAAIGSGFVCYYLGYSRGRKKEQEEERLKYAHH